MSDMGNSGGLAAALAVQAMKLKSAAEIKPLAPPKQKTEAEMSFAEQIAWKRE